jgi:cation transport regulator ChaB
MGCAGEEPMVAFPLGLGVIAVASARWPANAQKGGLMPRSSRYRQADELPFTLQRSCREAQELFTSAHASAVQIHGEGNRAYRVAYAALKEKFEKRDDHWIARRDPAV